MHMMVEALNMHVITVSWDLQYLTCLAESSRAKLKAIEVTEMNSGTTVSQPGNLFYDTLKVIQFAAKTSLLTKLPKEGIGARINTCLYFRYSVSGNEEGN